MASGERPWRCFVAVPIGGELRAAVEATVGALRARDDATAWRWTDPDGWHVTIAFLGATEPAAIPGLTRAIAEVAGAHPAFSLTAAGIGAFPSRTRARVLWYGIADPMRALRRLALAVQSAVGLPPDPRFRGHLTLARARDHSGTDASATIAVPAPAAPFVVDQLVLFRSHLGGGPARYEALAALPLLGGGS